MLNNQPQGGFVAMRQPTADRRRCEWRLRGRRQELGFFFRIWSGFLRVAIRGRRGGQYYQQMQQGLRQAAARRAQAAWSVRGRNRRMMWSKNWCHPALTRQF